MAAEDPLAPVALGCCSGRCGDSRRPRTRAPQPAAGPGVCAPPPPSYPLLSGSPSQPATEKRNHHPPPPRLPPPAREGTGWSFKPKPKLPGVTGHFITLTFSFDASELENKCPGLWAKPGWGRSSARSCGWVREKGRPGGWLPSFPLALRGCGDRGKSQPSEPGKLGGRETERKEPRRPSPGSLSGRRGPQRPRHLLAKPRAHLGLTAQFCGGRRLRGGSSALPWDGGRGDGWRKLLQRSEVIQASHPLGHPRSKLGKQRRCGDSLDTPEMLRHSGGYRQHPLRPAEALGTREAEGGAERRLVCSGSGAK